MIKILKFENIFGIKEVAGADQLGKVNVIYAPNGTAKSSISDALFNIVNGGSIIDVFDSAKVPSFEIDVDGTVFNESDNLNYRIIKYSGVDEYNLNNVTDYKPLVISNSLQLKVKSSIDVINASILNIENIILSCFPKKGRGKGGEKFSKPLKEAISLVAKTSKDNEIIINFVKNLNTSIKPLSESVSEDDFYLLVSEKSSLTLNNPIVKSNLNEYVAIVSKKIVSTILDDKFGIENLANFYKHSVEDNFFDDDKKRLIHISGSQYDKDGLKVLLDDETSRVYGTEEVRTKLNDCRAILNKNASSSKLANKIVSSPVLTSHSADYDVFVNELFVTLLDPVSVKKIEIEKANIIAEQSKLDLLRTTFDDSDSKLNKIWEMYKKRFAFNKFDLQIKNKFDAVIGYDVPQFVKYVKGTNIEVTNPKDMRFSTGEIRSFNLINLIIEIEKERLGGIPFVVILDDAVDSFDYKNKYGIIDYLAEISKDSNLQLIVFTHNFDFYRSLILSLDKNVTSQYFMYKNENDVVTFYDAKSKGYYLEVCKFNSWKNAPSVSQYFALIPFFRNVTQLESNSGNNDVKTIDNYLHYDDITSPVADFSGINAVLHTKRCNLPSVIAPTDKYLFELQKEVISIFSRTINETNLEEKVTLGLYIRVFTERFLSKKIIAAGGTIASISAYTKTRDLMNIAISLNILSDDEISLITEANVIAPSFVHANSFMYEPLIDVSSKPLIDIAKDLKTKNDIWPL